jgi:hypothetical protein
MIESIRNTFNKSYTDQKYQQLITDIEKDFPNTIAFRLAETPIFVDAQTKQKLLDAGNEICKFITGPTFKADTENSFKHVSTPAGESDQPECIVMDFAICINESNEVCPKLIELQGFPSLFAFEYLHHKAFVNNFEIPVGYSPFLNVNLNLLCITSCKEIKF